MRAKNKERLATLRMIQAAIKQKEIDERIELDDAQTLAILDKMAKQHRDSIEQFESADRKDLAEKEASELEVVQSFLPQQLSEDEIKALIEKAVADTGANGMADMGKLMGALKPQLQGRADMGKVSGLVKQALNS